MSHASDSPCLDNGAGRCWHCGYPVTACERCGCSLCDGSTLCATCANARQEAALRAGVSAGWADPADLTTAFPVLMSCGHVEMRRMRPSTARKLSAQQPDYEIRSQELCRQCSADHSAARAARLQGGAR